MYYMNDLYDLVTGLGYTSVRMWNDDALRSVDTGWKHVVELNPAIDIWFWTTGSNTCWTYANKGYQLYNILSDYTYYALTDDYFGNRKSFNQAYADQITELQQRGAKIDIAGLQMHRMAPQQSLDIASGTTADLSPEYVRTVLGRLEKTGLPVHISEITFTAVDNSERGQAIQALMTRNLYRLWFSLKPVMGITWWNPVDDCGAPREPSVSGFCTKRMEPKPAFHVLDHLINSEWKTDVELTADGTGSVKFRGFPGTYELVWKDESGRSCRAEYHALESEDLETKK